MKTPSKRCNVKFSEALASLNALSYELFLQGIPVLPAERKLAEDISASRNTVRKALACLEDEKKIFRDNRITYINSDFFINNNGAFLFITNGEEGRFWNDIPRRLWAEAQELARAMNFKSQLFLYKGPEDNDAVLEEIMKSDAVFLSSMTHLFRDQLLDVLKKSEKPFIALDQDLSYVSENYICLDNFAVGQLAAEIFLKSPYKKPAFLGYRRQHQYMPFKSRAKGFEDALTKAGCDDYEIFWIPVKETQEFVDKGKEKIRSILETDIDFLFVFTDEWIDLLTIELFEKRSIPDNFGLITLDGSGAAVRHNPKISSVTHGVSKTVLALFEQFKRIMENKIDYPVKMLIKPDYNPGETLLYEEA
jgi:DNA-binding LacI/PurR family transcriptional regulator